MAVDLDGREHIVLPSDGAYSNNAACVGGGTLTYGAMAWRYLPTDFRMRGTYGGVGHPGLPLRAERAFTPQFTPAAESGTTAWPPPVSFDLAVSASRISLGKLHSQPGGGHARAARERPPPASRNSSGRRRAPSARGQARRPILPKIRMRFGHRGAVLSRVGGAPVHAGCRIVNHRLAAARLVRPGGERIANLLGKVA